METRRGKKMCQNTEAYRTQQKSNRGVIGILERDLKILKASRKKIVA